MNSMTRVPTSRRRARALLGLFASLSAACGTPASDGHEISLSEYQRLNERDVEVLQLTKIDSVILGTAEDGVYEITDLEIRGRDLYIVDAKDKSVKVFDSSGRLIRRIGREGSGPGEFKDPLAVAFGDERMYVVDPSAGKRISLFGFDGRFVEMMESNIPTAPVSIAATGDLVFTMGGLSITDPERQGWDVMSVITASGEKVGQGCVMDPRYLASSKRDGMIGRFDFGAVSAREDRVYCIQTITPVVQVMDRSGKPARQIRLAPPFYTAPEDRDAVLNQKAIFDYLGSFTPHGRFFPVDSGFVSVYTRFDRELGEVRNHLFVCREVPRTHCGIVQNIGKPVYAASLDTVYIEEEVGPNEPMQIGIYRLSPAHGR
ncbi:MAG TPA: 6-bladed beta-propeller [Longimicrobiaceae bacterium]|nr:6-bladed beta-propeller [Longimicrobiaceae bacterium]